MKYSYFQESTDDRPEQHDKDCVAMTTDDEDDDDDDDDDEDLDQSRDAEEIDVVSEPPSANHMRL